MYVSGEAGSVVTVAGICPAVDRNRERKEREGKVKKKLTEIDKLKGRTTQEVLFTSQNKECVCVSPGMHFFARNMCGIAGITGTGKLDGRLFGVTPVLDLAVSSLRVLEATVMIERWRSLMLGQGRCHQCEMAL